MGVCFCFRKDYKDLKFVINIDLGAKSINMVLIIIASGL